MKVSGFTFIRNAVRLGYPVVESIRSILPICDEFIVNVGDSDDDTLGIIKSLNEPKIRIVQSKWNERMRVRGFVYAQQTNIAHYNCTGDWAFYLQGDEVVHEKELDSVYASMERHLNNPRIESLVFDYIHFYGNHMTCLDSPGWYRRESRIIRNTIRTISPSDGLFWVVLDRNKRARYPRAALANATIYHYGWVRSEEQMNAKVDHVSKFWGKRNSHIRYADVDPAILSVFKGEHPAVMKGWLPVEPAPFEPNPDYRPTFNDYRLRFKRMIERAFNVDFFKKHYKLVEK
jgi:glycosyltransferase involved in cell wall biosynthesis